MKLRNKKTGETGYLELEKGDSEKYIGLRVYKNDFMYKRYQSLAELNAEWEDYTPQEPLIKDEKTRKAVRAWAEANDMDKYESEQRVVYNCAEHRLTWVSTCIEFNESRNLENLIDGETYAITELCGESEQ